MSATPEQIAKLQTQIARAETRLENLRAKLAELLAGQGGKPPKTGLDLLWETALPTSRNRSSKQECRSAWDKIPAAERPTVARMIAALKAWNASPEWRKDGGAFAKGLHRWIKNRGWESIPETSAAPSRYRSNPKPVPQVDPAEAVTDRCEIRKLLGIAATAVTDRGRPADRDHT